MFDDDPPGLSPEYLRRYRLTLLPPGDSRHLLVAEEVAELVASDVMPNALTDRFLGAVFVDDLASPLAWSQPYLGYIGNHRVDTKTFLNPGMLLHAEGLFLFHHRGSRPPEPRRRDLQVARRVLKAGEQAGVQLLDYLMLGDGRWTSLEEAGRVRFPPIGGKAPRDGRADVKPKYRNPECPSQTWAGRGHKARWLSAKIKAGAELEDFKVEDD